MSKVDHGKKPSIKMHLLSYFQKLPSKNTYSLHASSSFEQYVSERYVNSCENASNIHMMDDIIDSSSDHGEINSSSREIGDKNLEYFSLEGDTLSSRKRKKGQWDIGRQFQPDWASTYPFIEPILPTNENEPSR